MSGIFSPLVVAPNADQAVLADRVQALGRSSVQSGEKV
jgi:hypothetical protein